MRVVPVFRAASGSERPTDGRTVPITSLLPHRRVCGFVHGPWDARYRSRLKERERERERERRIRLHTISLGRSLPLAVLMLESVLAGLRIRRRSAHRTASGSELACGQPSRTQPPFILKGSGGPHATARGSSARSRIASECTRSAWTATSASRAERRTPRGRARSERPCSTECPTSSATGRVPRRLPVP